MSRTVLARRAGGKVERRQAEGAIPQGGAHPHRPAADWFNDADFARSLSHYWFMPTRLADESGKLADLWLSSNGSAAIKVLLIYLIHCRVARAGNTWSEWWSLPQPRVAALAGLDRGSVRRAVDSLVAARLAEVRRRPHGPHAGGYVIDLRLASDLFRRGREKFVMIPASLVYGGWISLLSAAETQVYVAVCGRDGILDEASYSDAMEQRADGVGFSDEDARQERLAEVRRRAPALSHAGLQRCSGCSVTAIKKARPMLFNPIPCALLAEPFEPTAPRMAVRRAAVASPALVTEIRGTDGAAWPRWYAPCRPLQMARLRPALLADAPTRRRVRALISGQAEMQQTPGTFAVSPGHICTLGGSESQHLPGQIRSIAGSQMQHVVEKEQRSYTEEKPELSREKTDVRRGGGRGNSWAWSAALLATAARSAR